MRISSWHAVAFIVVVSALAAFSQIPREDWASSAAMSLACGVAALSLMGAAALLGGRLGWVEDVFGGLDRVYIAHKWLAIWALGFALVHFTFKAEIEEWPLASILALPPQYTRLVRQLSLVALGLIVMLALNRKIPYNTWRWWHKLSGPLFLIVILHWLSIKTPIELTSPAGVWLALMAGLGVIAAGYKLLLYPLSSPHARYRVVAANPGASGLHLQLEPVRGQIDVKPGQFGFLSMKEDGLREPHPFTIASGGGGNRPVHFVVRDLGDYTRKLVRETRPGMQAEIYAPFGRFHRPQGARRELWIAGGVGVSPFIAWFTDESARGFENVTFFYFYTPGREFPSAGVLQEMATQRGAQFVAVSQGPGSPDFVDRFRERALSAGPQALSVSFCGPKGLLHAVRAQMRSNGVPESNLHYEYFEFR